MYQLRGCRSHNSSDMYISQLRGCREKFLYPEETHLLRTVPVQLGCLALRSVDGKDSEALFVMIAVTGVTMAFNTGVAFVVGVVCAGVFYLRTYVIDLVRRRSEQNPTPA